MEKLSSRCALHKPILLSYPPYFTIQQHIECNRRGLNIKLINVSFPENVIDRYWLNAAVPVNDLKIYSYTNLKISPISFDGSVFDELRALTLSNIEIVNEQHQKIRIAVPPIEDMAINDSRFTFKGICNNFRDSLRHLQVQDLQNGNPMVVTGNITLKALEIVHFRHNSFRDSIHRQIFQNMRSVKKLIMTNCNIEYIWYNAFHYLGANTEHIDLRHNKMTRLTSGIFNVFLHKQGVMKILLDDNPWLCDCTEITDIFERLPCLEQKSNKCLSDLKGNSRPSTVVPSVADAEKPKQHRKMESEQRSTGAPVKETKPLSTIPATTTENTPGPTIESSTEPTPTPTRIDEDKLEDELEDEHDEKLKHDVPLKKDGHRPLYEGPRRQEDRLRHAERLRHRYEHFGFEDEFDDHFMDRYEDRLERRMSRLHRTGENDDEDEIDNGSCRTKY